jgi:hypothetical protein
MWILWSERHIVVDSRELDDSPSWTARGEFGAFEACEIALQWELDNHYAEEKSRWEASQYTTIDKARFNEVHVYRSPPVKGQNRLETSRYRCFPANIDPKGH